MSLEAEEEGKIYKQRRKHATSGKETCRMQHNTLAYLQNNVSNIYSNNYDYDDGYLLFIIIIIIWASEFGITLL